jgi:hypothetical protein
MIFAKPGNVRCLEPNPPLQPCLLPSRQAVIISVVEYLRA